MTSTDESTRRDYRNTAGKKLPGVTTILGDSLGWSKNGLLGWAYKKGCEATRDELHEILRQRAENDGPVLNADDVTFHAAAAMEKRAHNKQRDNAADAGTVCHALIQAHVAGKPPVGPEIASVPAEIFAAGEAAYKRWLAWFIRNDVTVLHSEKKLVDEVGGYGGTFDAVLRIGDRVLLGDWKSGKDAYDEVVLQLGGYDLLCDLHEIVPRSGALVVNVPTDAARDVQVIEISREQLNCGRELFLAALKIYKMKSSVRLNKVPK